MRAFLFLPAFQLLSVSAISAETFPAAKSGQLARIHAVWALTQDGSFFEKAFNSLATSDDPELRARAAILLEEEDPAAVIAYAEAAQCVACPRIGDEGSELVPPLTEIGKKGREYILESLLDPQAKITPGYSISWNIFPG